MNLRGVQHLRPKEVAVLIRQALAVRWPKRKFKVRTHLYAGGASVYVSWPFISEVDDSEVRRVARQFQGRGFDGMTDCSYALYHWLTPGPSATLAYSPGSGLLADVVERPKPCEDAELVGFGVSVSAGSIRKPPPATARSKPDNGLPF